MLTIKTELRQSHVHGLGVFAAEFIPAGTVVWVFQPDFDFRVSESTVAALPEVARERLLHYSAKWGGGYVISADDSRFLNHSESPNLRTMNEPDADVAVRDIHPGEELLEDYREFDETFRRRPIQAASSLVWPLLGEPVVHRLNSI
ncbi:MAG TPA: SET domain-containing protein [Bryobacteraceae bacterium]|nr:SET domain-containing protein [Bryobacteraceae bacterium]